MFPPGCDLSSVDSDLKRPRPVYNESWPWTGFGRYDWFCRSMNCIELSEFHWKSVGLNFDTYKSSNQGPPLSETAGPRKCTRRNPQFLCEMLLPSRWWIALGLAAAHQTTWWLIPLSKWVITPVISGLTLLIPFITGVITHLLSGMSHQVAPIWLPDLCEGVELVIDATVKRRSAIPGNSAPVPPDVIESHHASQILWISINDSFGSLAMSWRKMLRLCFPKRLVSHPCWAIRKPMYAHPQVTFAGCYLRGQFLEQLNASATPAELLKLLATHRCPTAVDGGWHLRKRSTNLGQVCMSTHKRVADVQWAAMEDMEVIS